MTFIGSIFDLQAELCQTMSNASRLRIVHCLREGPRCVGDIVQATRLAQPKVSQHLSLLRSRGIVAAQRKGSEMEYRLANPKNARVCDLMREVLADQAAERSELLLSFNTVKQ
jgi:DNA-binding transcriptional ArsR family regulator